jgi:hypothetical protein
VLNCVLCNEERVQEHELCEEHLKTYYWVNDELNLGCEHEKFLTTIYSKVCDGATMIREPTNKEIVLMEYLEYKKLIKIDRCMGWYVSLTSDGKTVVRFVILQDSK